MLKFDSSVVLVDPKLGPSVLSVSTESVTDEMADECSSRSDFWFRARACCARLILRLERRGSSRLLFSSIGAALGLSACMNFTIRLLRRNMVDLFSRSSVSRSLLNIDAI